MIECFCKISARLHFSKLKRLPFIGCINRNKILGKKCFYDLDLLDETILKNLNKMEGRIHILTV